MPASILDLRREEGERKSCLTGGWILLERKAFHKRCKLEKPRDQGLPCGLSSAGLRLRKCFGEPFIQVELTETQFERASPNTNSDAMTPKCKHEAHGSVWQEPRPLASGGNSSFGH